MPPSPARLALPIGLLTFAVYLALVPWTRRVWLRTGDEPHYLIAAHSIAFDGDFDLSNNYDPNIYLDWFSAANLGPQGRAQADGSQYLAHTYGLSFLLAPIYRLGGAQAVPYFLAALGALLAAQVYLLGVQVTGDWRASAVGWFVMAFSPPVVWYVFLVYPELAGALCVTVAVRELVKSQGPKSKLQNAIPTQSSVEGKPHFDFGPLPFGPLIFGFALAFLPWLSARFIPVMLTLTVLAIWRGWRDRASLTTYHLPALGIPILGLLSFLIFNALLYANPAPTASYTEPIQPLGLSWSVAYQFARGVLGWLMDHQRGLLVSSPAYGVAFIGLGQWLARRAWGAFVAAATFFSALFSISLFGGFWVGVEPAARFLVFALPPLGAAVAYGWAHRRGPWLAILAAAGMSASLWAAYHIFRDPLLAQTHDLFDERAPWLVRYLPSMGRPTYLFPSGEGTAAAQIDEDTWRTPLGKGGVAFRQDAIPDFSFGWYDVILTMGASGASGDEPVARVLFQAGDNTRLLQAILAADDFPPDGTPRTFTFPIHNPVYNQWEQPPGIWIFTTGKAELTFGPIALLPDGFRSLGLAALWLAGLSLVGVLVARPFNAAPIVRDAPTWLTGRPMIAALVLLVLGAAWWSSRPFARTYGVSQLRHLVGRSAPDAAAADGQALVADPSAGDVEGVLVSTRAQFYSPGRWAWRLRLRAGQAPPEAIIARARIYAARQPVVTEMTPIPAEAVPADGQYHTLVVEFENPVEQALVFELKYTATTMLFTDRFEVTPAP